MKRHKISLFPALLIQLWNASYNNCAIYFTVVNKLMDINRTILEGSMMFTIFIALAIIHCSAHKVFKDAQQKRSGVSYGQTLKLLIWSILQISFEAHLPAMKLFFCFFSTRFLCIFCVSRVHHFREMLLITIAIIDWWKLCISIHKTFPQIIANLGRFSGVTFPGCSSFPIHLISVFLCGQQPGIN